jgi:hypothetical protein
VMRVVEAGYASAAQGCVVSLRAEAP